MGDRTRTADPLRAIAIFALLLALVSLLHG
jgi:hypothetical protein